MNLGPQPQPPIEEATHCAYCDREFVGGWHGSARTKDHIIPPSLGLGPLKVFAGRGNLVAACGACNGLKANMMPDAIRMHAHEHRKRARLLEQMADRVEDLIEERGLLPHARET